MGDEEAQSGPQTTIGWYRAKRKNKKLVLAIPVTFVTLTDN